MRTTLTIDDDIAAILERLRRTRDASLRDLINDALRRGLRDMSVPPKKREPFRTDTVDVQVRVSNVDNIAEVIAAVEGETFK